MNFLKDLRDLTAYETFTLEVSRTHLWSIPGQVCEHNPTGHALWACTVLWSVPYVLTLRQNISHWYIKLMAFFKFQEFY